MMIGKVSLAIWLFCVIMLVQGCELRSSRPKAASKKPKAEQISYDFHTVNEYIKPRLASGASASAALGKYQDATIKWRVQVSKDCICYGLSGNPVELEKEDAVLFGRPSSGLDGLKFLIFCEQNEGKLIDIEGELLSATDNVGRDKNIAYEIVVSRLKICE